MGHCVPGRLLFLINAGFLPHFAIGPLSDIHFFSFTFSCLYFITFYRCFQTQITPALCHWSTPAIELKLAGGGRRHSSLEWLRNSLAPTSNQPPNSVLSSFPSRASVSPAHSNCHCPGWGLNRLLLLSFLWLLPLHSRQTPPFEQFPHCFHHSPALKPLGAAHCLKKVQPKLRIQTLCASPRLPS